MRADASTLRDPLGRETFIPQNHLCVVDLPAVAGDDVKVLFIGVQDGASATVQTSMSTRNDPSRFTPPWWWRSSFPGLRGFPELAPAG